MPRTDCWRGIVEQPGIFRIRCLRQKIGCGLDTAVNAVRCVLCTYHTVYCGGLIAVTVCDTVNAVTGLPLASHQPACMVGAFDVTYSVAVSYASEILNSQ